MRDEAAPSIKTQVDKVLACLGAPQEAYLVSRRIANLVWNNGQTQINVNGRRYKLSYNPNAMAVQCQEVLEQ